MDAVHSSSSGRSGNELFHSWTPASPQGTWDLAESGAASNTNGARGPSGSSVLPMMLGALSPPAALIAKFFGAGHQTTNVSAANSAPSEHSGAGGKESFGRNETVPRHAEEHYEDASHMLSQRSRQRLEDFRYSMAVWETLDDVTREQVLEMVGWLAFIGVFSVVAARGKGLGALRALLKSDLAKALGYAIPAGAASVHFSNWFNAAWDANGGKQREFARKEFGGLCMSLAAWRMQFGFGKGASAKAPGKVTAEVDNAAVKTRAQLGTTAAANTTTLQLNPTTNQYEVPLGLPGPTGGDAAIEPIPSLGGGSPVPSDYHDASELITRLQRFPELSAYGQVFAQGGQPLDSLIETATEPQKSYLLRLKQLQTVHNGAPAIRTSKTANGPLFPNADVLVVANAVPGPGAAGGLVTGVTDSLQGQKVVWAGAGNGVAAAAHGTRHVDDSDPNFVRVKYDIEESTKLGHYVEVCNEGIWPAQHRRTDLISCTPAGHKNYTLVNRFFGGRVSELVPRKVPVWGHDYHFMEMAEFVEPREAGVGNFSHIPQVEYEIFRRIPGWENLIKGVLANDLAGFQTWLNAMNFIDLAKRVGAEEIDIGDSTLRGLRYKNHITRVGAYPIGINAQKFLWSPTRTPPQELMALPGFGQIQIIGGVERFDYTKGILERLLAYQRLLRNKDHKYRNWRSKVSMVQIAVPSRGGIDGYEQLAVAVEALVDEINEEFMEKDASGKITWRPVTLFKKSYDQRALGAWYDNFDVTLVTPPKGDGMNLVAKESIAAQNPEDPGVLLLSKFAGAAEQLQTAVLTDPNDIEGLADDMERGLTMSRDERIKRNTPMLKNVIEQSAAWWGQSFTSDLKKVRKKSDK